MDAPTGGEPIDLLVLCRTIKSNAGDVAAAILERWAEISEAEPWLRLPDDLDYDHLPQLIRDLAAAALCTDFDRDMCRRVVRTSAGHGEHRSAEGLDEALIYREYHLLRRALWQELREEHGESATTYYATMRIDALVGLANASAMHGLHRSSIGGDREWEEVLDELLDQWPLPSH